MFAETYNYKYYAVTDTTSMQAREQAINKQGGTYNVHETLPTYKETGYQYNQKGLKAP